MDRRIIAAVSSVFLAGATASLTRASSYASQISESGGNISFTLNEAADDVVIIRDGVPTSLGALGVGSHTVARSGATNYSLRVSKTAASGYLNATGLTTGVNLTTDGTPLTTPLIISDDNNIRNSFNSPRGMTVNRNASNGSLFGLVYVSNSAAGGPTGGFPTPARTLGDGIYVNGADGSDPFAQVDTALTASLNFGAGGASAPYRLAIDKAGFLYISDWSDAAGTVYRTDAQVTTGGAMLAGIGSGPAISPTNALNHGSVAAVYVEGTSAGGNLTLYTIDEDLTPDPTTPTQLNGLWKYEIGAGTVSGNDMLPTQMNGSYGQIDFVSQTMDMTRGPDGKFYITNRRSDGSQPGLFVLAPDGTKLYDSLADAIARNIDGNSGVDGLQDPIRETFGVAASPDGQYVAALRADSTACVVPLIDGIPDLPNRMVVQSFDPANFGRDIEFDAAGNLYVVSSGTSALRVLSPGKVSLTTYNSDGTFTYHNEPEWFVAGGGSSSTSTNWMLGYVPNGKSEIALFGSSISAPATVTVDAGLTLGTIKFAGANKYTIAGTNTITLDSYGEPRVTVLSGSHEISAPVTANQNLQITTIGASSAITMSNLTLSDGAGSVSLVKAGAGRARVTNAGSYTGLTTVQAGTLELVGPSSYAPVLTGAGANIIKGRLVLDYTGSASVAADVLATLDAGYDQSPKFSSGDVFTTSDTSGAIGLGWTNNTTTSQVTVGYTYYGDSNLDGQVDITDLAALATAWQTAGVWGNGDFNYDGVIDITDLAALATNWQLGVGAPLGMTFDQALASVGLGGVAVPEPATLGALALGASMLVRRRRA